MRWLRTRQSFKKTREVKKLALTTYFIKSKEELGCVILSVFSTVKWWSSFLNISRPKVKGTGLIPPPPPPSFYSCGPNLYHRIDGMLLASSKYAKGHLLSGISRGNWSQYFEWIINRGYYVAARRYEMSLRVLRKIFHEWARSEWVK